MAIAAKNVSSHTVTRNIQTEQKNAAKGAQRTGTAAAVGENDERGVNFVAPDEPPRSQQRISLLLLFDKKSHLYLACLIENCKDDESIASSPEELPRVI